MPFYPVHSHKLLYIVTIFMIMNKFITILMFLHGAWKLHALSSYGLDTPLNKHCLGHVPGMSQAHMETRLNEEVKILLGINSICHLVMACFHVL